MCSGLVIPALARDTAARLVERFSSLTIAVVGDVMLDRFVFGRVTRISPEAPVPVVTYEREEVRAGGAANAACNLRALGAQVALVGLVGNDEAGERLREALAAHQIGSDGLVVDPTRPTTTKVRIVTERKQQVARLDYESDADLGGTAEAALLAQLDQILATTDALVISDYLKGVVTERVMQHALAGARTRRIPVLVDPKIPHLPYYAGASVVTPNHQEAEAATHLRIRSDEDARAAARAFRRQVGCDSVLLTRGEHGLWVLDGLTGLEGGLAARAREVADVTGAGDTVIAIAALALAAGASLAEAAQLANHGAGVVVGRFGPASLTPDELLATFDEHAP